MVVVTEEEEKKGDRGQRRHQDGANKKDREQDGLAGGCCVLGTLHSLAHAIVLMMP